MIKMMFFCFPPTCGIAEPRGRKQKHLLSLLKHPRSTILAKLLLLLLFFFFKAEKTAPSLLPFFGIYVFTSIRTFACILHYIYMYIYIYLCAY